MSELKTLIQHAAGTKGADPCVKLTCKVISCNVPGRLCMVSPINNNGQPFAAQLMSEIDDGLLIVPAVTSTVKVIYSNLNAPTVVQYSQIDQLLVIAGDTRFSLINGTATLSQGATSSEPGMVVTLTGGKINIKNNSQNFTTILQDILTQIGNIAQALITPANVLTPSGNGQFEPTTVANITNANTAISEDATKLQQLLS